MAIPPVPMPQAGAGTAPGQPPFGAAAVSQPVPNRGLQAAALAQVQVAVRILEKSIPMLGVETEPGHDVAKALTILSKHIPPGAASPGVEQNAMHDLMMQQRQEAPMLMALRAQGQQPQAAPPAAPAAA